MLIESLNRKLNKQRENRNLRRLHLSNAPIDFASNDYLGFARNPFLREETLNAWRNSSLGCGSTGSRLLTGNSSLANRLEDAIASYHGAPAGLLFHSGYHANIGLLSAIMTAEDHCFFDAHVHASCHDGIRLSQAKPIPWRHNDLENLEKRLKKRGLGHAFVVIASVYSCDGSKAPLSSIAEICRRFEAYLIVDEAHATGVIGKRGEGCVADQQCEVFARVHTFSKALGGYGGIVLGSSLLKEFLINSSRPLIYATMLPPVVLLGIQKAYELLPQGNRERLNQLIAYFRSKADRFPLIPSDTPIQALLIPGNQPARDLAAHLQHLGFDVRALTSPTVKPGTERVRICLHVYNTTEEIDALIHHIGGQL